MGDDYIYIDELRQELKEIKFHAVYPRQYAENLDSEFRRNPSKWFEVVIPKEKAIELREKTKNSFIQLWHVHCYCCWKNIDKSNNEQCFVSENEAIWLCKSCYNKVIECK